MPTPAPTLYDLAETLHEKLCHHDHTDQCTWFYEIGRAYLWQEFTHKQYIQKAYKLRKETPLTTKTATLIQIIKSL